MNSKKKVDPKELMKTRPAGPAYTYRAVVRSIYDGDSMTVDIDLGFGTWMKGQKLRLYGVDTPELRGEERDEGIMVRDRVRMIAPYESEIILQSLKDKSGKFGRWLAIIWTPYVGTSVNQWLIDEGMAKEYYGGRR